MRLVLSLGAVTLALAGCVAPIAAPVAPPAPPVVAVPAKPVAPKVINDSSRTVARDVVSREMARRLPGQNVGPYTDCVLNNATMAEVSDLASRAGSESAGAADAVASIVKRPAATQCIAKVAATA